MNIFQNHGFFDNQSFESLLKSNDALAVTPVLGTNAIGLKNQKRFIVSRTDLDTALRKDCLEEVPADTI